MILKQMVMKKILSFVLVALATMFVTIGCTGVDTPDNPSVPVADVLVKDAFEKGAIVTIQFIYRGEAASITFENTGDYPLSFKMVDATGAAVNPWAYSLVYDGDLMEFIFCPARLEDGTLDGMYVVDFDSSKSIYSDMKEGRLEDDENTCFISLSVNGRPVNLTYGEVIVPSWDEQVIY